MGQADPTWGGCSGFRLEGTSSAPSAALLPGSQSAASAPPTQWTPSCCQLRVCGGGTSQWMPSCCQLCVGGEGTAEGVQGIGITRQCGSIATSLVHTGTGSRSQGWDIINITPCWSMSRYWRWWDTNPDMPTVRGPVFLKSQFQWC